MKLNKIQFILGWAIIICSIILMYYRAGVMTCANSCIGCGSYEELMYDTWPDLFNFFLLLFGAWISGHSFLSK